jgi:lipopolysaccharide transport system ATP-binding protein
VKPVIQVRGLSKRYRIGERRVRYATLRDSLAGIARSPLRALRRMREEHPTIWALKDVSFDVMPGEVVGIIGRNGAGKSTLLKILTRITEPTEGSAELHGRVASLLDVGTGFHPELTGRENIFLNGAILGMRRAEIARKFDEIVAFAEVEPFIDTPVKHYSSGMYVRLAFAVAAHLEPEILLVDEVLAVGDVAFQKKSLGKMGEVARGGRTVLLVSHNMLVVQKLCERTVLLESGHMLAHDETDRVVERYLAVGAGSSVSSWELPPPSREAPAALLNLELLDARDTRRSEFQLYEPWRARVTFEVRRAIPHFICALAVIDAHSVAVGTQWSEPVDIVPGVYRANLHWAKPALCAGHYRFTAGLSSYESTFHYVEEHGLLHITEASSQGHPVRATNGVLLVESPLVVSPLN